MSLTPDPTRPGPADTARVAKAAFPPYLLVRDHLGSIFTDEMFVPLFAERGRRTEAPWRLALITVMQCAEGLFDRQAAEAVRARIDGT